MTDERRSSTPQLDQEFGRMSEDETTAAAAAESAGDYTTPKHDDYNVRQMDEVINSEACPIQNPLFVNAASNLSPW